MTFNKLSQKSILTLLGFCFFAVACNNDKREQEDLQKSVIAIHDSVMMDMGVLMEKKTQINKTISQLDSLKLVKTNLDTNQVRTDLKKIVKELASADEGMMDWMHNFSPDYSGKSHQQIIAYLTQQKTKIISVDSAIKKVVIKSDSVIAVYK